MAGLLKVDLINGTLGHVLLAFRWGDWTEQSEPKLLAPGDTGSWIYQDGAPGLPPAGTQCCAASINQVGGDDLSGSNFVIPAEGTRAYVTYLWNDNGWTCQQGCID